MTKAKILTWDQDFHSVGDKEMNEHHKIIFELINKISPDFNKNANFDEKIKAIKVLIKYSELHFLSEETMMTKINFKDRFSHCLLHEKYNDKLSLFLNNIEEIELEVIHEYILNWWKNHILIEDMKYKSPE